jgi:hypothetical protein
MSTAEKSVSCDSSFFYPLLLKLNKEICLYKQVEKIEYNGDQCKRVTVIFHHHVVNKYESGSDDKFNSPHHHVNIYDLGRRAVVCEDQYPQHYETQKGEIAWYYWEQGEIILRKKFVKNYARRGTGNYI